jgi:hypothetical protein
MVYRPREQRENVMKHTNKYVLAALAALFILVVGFTAFSPVLAHGKLKGNQIVFHDAMRKLWEDHITWTRLYIISAAEDLPDKALTAQRLLQNQADIGDAIKRFYGEAAGDQLTALLEEHILIAAELIDAAKAGDDDAFADAHGRYCCLQQGSHRHPPYGGYVERRDHPPVPQGV